MNINYRTFICSLPIIKGAEIPSEIQVLPFGEHHTSKGDFILNENSAAQIISTFDKQKNDMVIDYEHQTLEGVQAPAAGWIKKLINKGTDGIWAVVEWTNNAAKYLKNREYRYVSPVFLKQISDNAAVRLINVAVTNQPAIDGMTPMVNKGFFMEESMKEKLLGIFKMKEGSSEQIVSKVKTLAGDFASISGKLDTFKVDAAKKEKVISDLTEAKNKNDAFLKEIAGELGLKNEDSSTLKASILALKSGSTSAEQLSAKLAALETGIKEKEAAGLVDFAMKEGKLIPAQKEWALKYAKNDLEGFKVYVEKAAKLIDYGNGMAGAVESPGSVDPATLLVGKQLGVGEDDLKKFIKEEK